MMNKQDLMKELLNLYEQREFIEIPCTKFLVDSYIRKLELKLKKLL